MADYSIIQQGDTVQYGIYSLEVDTLAKKDALPTNIFGAGSTVIVLENSSVWMLGTDGIWHEL